MTEPRTGVFELSVEIGPEATKAERDFRSFQLLNEMTRKVNSLVKDGCSYELQARIVGKWEPSEIWPAAERLRLDFTLVLLNPLTAEVGEWVKDLPERMPEGCGRCRLGEGFGEASGRVFERGHLGWCRIE